MPFVKGVNDSSIYWYTYDPRLCTKCAEYMKIQISMSSLKTLSKQSFDNFFFVNSIPCNIIYIEHSQKLYLDGIYWLPMVIHVYLTFTSHKFCTIEISSRNTQFKISLTH